MVLYNQKWWCAMTLKQLTEMLKTNGYKTTEPRKIILSLLLQNIDNLLTADDVYHIAKKVNNKVNRSTVYRNIEILSDLGLLYKSINSEGVSRIKLLCSTEHHHHLICDICGKIVIYHACDNEAYSQFAEGNGFKLTGHTLELHGICDTCQMKTS